MGWRRKEEEEEEEEEGRKVTYTLPSSVNELEEELDLLLWGHFAPGLAQPAQSPLGLGRLCHPGLGIGGVYFPQRFVSVFGLLALGWETPQVRFKEDMKSGLVELPRPARLVGEEGTKRNEENNWVHVKT